MSVSSSLFQLIKTSPNLKNLARRESNFRKNSHVNFFFEKRLCEGVVDVHLMTLQVLESHDNEKQA